MQIIYLKSSGEIVNVADFFAGISELYNNAEIYMEIDVCIQHSELPENGTADRVYLAADENKLYQWEGSEYIEITNVDTTINGHEFIRLTATKLQLRSILAQMPLNGSTMWTAVQSYLNDPANTEAKEQWDLAQEIASDHIAIRAFAAADNITWMELRSVFELATVMP